jgi:hypothetical protein
MAAPMPDEAPVIRAVEFEYFATSLISGRGPPSRRFKTHLTWSVQDCFFLCCANYRSSCGVSISSNSAL